MTRILKFTPRLKLLQNRFFSSEASESSLDYCTKIVRFWYFAFFTDRQHDHENFLATLLITKAIRTPALVVRAFNVEIAKVQDQTSDPKICEFRLQFWHDAVSTIYNKEKTYRNVPANPVAQELYKVCKSYNLPKRSLEKLISSRNAHLKSKYFRTIEDMEHYAEDTVSTVYYLILNISGIANVHADHAASHLGKAQGMANILRSIHVSNHHKMVSLPMDLLMHNKVSQESVLREMDSESLRNVTFDIASRANSHLQKARSIAIPKLAKQIFLPAISVESYLKRLEACNFNVFERTLRQSSSLLPFNLYFKRLLNKY